MFEAKCFSPRFRVYKPQWRLTDGHKFRRFSSSEYPAPSNAAKRSSRRDIIGEGRRRMAPLYTTGFLACLMVVAGAAHSEKCHIPNADWEDLVNQYLAKIPEQEVFTRNDSDSNRFNVRISGFTFGDLTLSGLSNLIRYGTVKAYCENDKPYVTVNMAARSPIKTRIPWKYCGGMSGIVGSQANVVKLCIGFDVAEVDGKVVLRPSAVYPKWIDSLEVKLEGAGDVMQTAVYVVGKLLTPFVKDLWIQSLPWRMQKMLERMAN